MAEGLLITPSSIIHGRPVIIRHEQVVIPANSWSFTVTANKAAVKKHKSIDFTFDTSNAVAITMRCNSILNFHTRKNTGSSSAFSAYVTLDTYYTNSGYTMIMSTGTVSASNGDEHDYSKTLNIEKKVYPLSSTESLQIWFLCISYCNICRK